MGELMYYGLGVGVKLIVISVVSDLIMIVKNICLVMIGYMFNLY